MFDETVGVFDKEQGWITVPNIEKIADILVKRYKLQSDENKRLSEENEKLKCDIWEHEEIKRLKEENEKLKQDMKHSFIISQEEYDKIKEWESKIEKRYTGAIGGRFSYEFMPTSIGSTGMVVDDISGSTYTFRDLS